MDPDMNIYDLEHVCTGHEAMSKAEWQGIYNKAWGSITPTATSRR